MSVREGVRDGFAMELCPNDLGDERPTLLGSRCQSRQNDFCRSWIEIAKILLHPDAGKLGNGACKLDPCGAAADNDEGGQSPPLHLARGHLGMFEGLQHPTADKSCVFHAL